MRKNYALFIKPPISIVSSRTFKHFLQLFLGIFYCCFLTLHSHSQLETNVLEQQDIEKLPNDEEKEKTAYSFIAAAKELYHDHQYDSAFFYIDIAKQIANQVGSEQLYADVFYAEGRAHYYKGNHEQAGEAYLKSIPFRKELMDTSKLGKTYNSLGVVRKHQGKYYEAVKALNEAMHYYHLAEDEKGMARVELNMGNVLKNTGKTEQAKKRYKNALAIFIEHDLKSDQASSMNNLGNLFKNEEEYDSAYHYLSQTLKLRKELDDEILLSFAYHNMANLYSNMELFDSAIYYMEASLAIKTKYNNRLQIAGDYESYGSIHSAQENWPEAVMYYEKALAIFDSVGFVEDKLSMTKDLAEAYLQNGQSNQSAKMYQLHFAIQDSLDDQTDGTLLQEELNQYEYFTDSIQNEQERLQRQLEETQVEKKQLAIETSEKRLFYLVIIIGLITLMLTGFFISSRRRLKQTADYQSVLQEQNEELKRTLISKEEKEILLKEIHHRVKNNLQIINSLIRLQSNFMNEGNFQEKLTETENRIRSMALIHEKLYKSKDLTSLSIRNYLEELSIHILESYENDWSVKLTFDVEEQNFGIDSLIPLGLIINEILSNSMKYAFFERQSGKIGIELKTVGEKTILNVWDNGIGADMSPEELGEDSLGMDIIFSLTEQLDGEIGLNTQDGFHYAFEFPPLK